MATGRGARAIARQQITAEILTEAKAQLARDGASGLSLRSIARTLEMSSSAIYRYFASRDELLTALILDAYNDLGATVEAAEAAVERSDLRGRWLAATRATRAWARAEPHAYALIYGTPVPNYVAPQSTISAASRVPIVLVGILIAAAREHPMDPSSGPTGVLDPGVLDTIDQLAQVPEAKIIHGIRAWNELFGIISFELFGHLVGSVADTEAYFEQFCHETADRLLT